jgi:hypothetical protein
MPTLMNLAEDRVTFPVDPKGTYKRIGSILDRGLVGADQPSMPLTNDQAAFVKTVPLIRDRLEPKAGPGLVAAPPPTMILT